jgi:hypothetical protein
MQYALAAAQREDRKRETTSRVHRNGVADQVIAVEHRRGDTFEDVRDLHPQRDEGHSLVRPNLKCGAVDARSLSLRNRIGTRALAPRFWTTVGALLIQAAELRLAAAWAAQRVLNPISFAQAAGAWPSRCSRAAPGIRRDMKPIRTFGASRPGGIAHVDSTPAEHEARKIRAALAEIDQFGNLRSFAGARHEKLALFTTIRERGLVAWKRTCGQYELTLAGRKWLMNHGGTPARRRLRATPIAATLGMAVLAGVWFSGDASHRLFGLPSGSAPAMASPPAPQTASIAARAEARPMNAPADQSPPRIRADAAALPTADLPPPQSSDIADSAPPRSEQLEAPATRKVAARSRRKAPRVARQGRDDRGPAMVLMESGRPPRGAAAGPGWGGWYPGQNVWR